MYLNIIRVLKSESLKSGLIIIIILALIQAILESLVIFILPNILKTLIFNEPTVISIKNFSFNFHDYDYVTLTIFCITFIVIKNIFNLFYFFCFSKYIAKTQSFLNTNIFSTQMKKSYDSFMKINSSEYIKNVTHDSSNYINFSITPLITLIAEFLIMLFIFITLLFINTKFTIFFVLLSMIIYFVFNVFTKKILVSAGQTNQKKQAELVKLMKESYLSFKEIYLYNLQAYFVSNFKKMSDLLASGISKNIFYGNIPRILIESLFIIFILVSLSLMLNYKTSELVVIFGTFGFAALRLIPSLSKVFVSISSIKFGSSSCEVLDKLLSLKKKDDLRISPLYAEYTDSLIVSNISHKYDDKLILNNVNLSINSKDFVAIIGDSGSGKTTLLNIMLGLINPQTGSVTSNDYSISTSPNLWRSIIGYVPQSINLIDENIYKNVALGIEDSLINKKKIDGILDRLSIINLKNKSDGQELLLGENSQNISGGQNQRIGIAKALYRDPKILILDEFTSALDNENQERILNTIKKLDVTVIMATHRLNSLTHCNKVFKLQKNLLTQIK